MPRNCVYRIFVVNILLGLLIASCSPATNQPIITATSQEMDIPASSTSTLAPSKTSTMQSTPMTKTQTPTTFIIVTDTPDVCPPFEFNTELPDPDLPENYIGYHLNSRELPSGLEYSGGRSLRDESQEYVLVIDEFIWHENRHLFLLQKLICRDESGTPYFEVVDALATPPLSGDETVPWVCFKGDTEVNFASGFGVYDKSLPKETIGDYQGWPYTKLIFLYSIDFAAQQLHELDVEGVKCLEGGGMGPY